MRIALVTDAWHPQICGVVHTLSTMQRILTGWGHELLLITPQGAKGIPVSFIEPGLKLAWAPGSHVKRILGDTEPDVLHIATEGPLGLAARRLALRRGWRFTTGLHTLFPEYLEARLGIPADLMWRFMRWFHAPSQRVLVPTPTVRDIVASKKLERLQVWSRGVDTDTFQPGVRNAFGSLPRPIFLNVGRTSKEKNLDAFLQLDLPGSKVVVGGGPDLNRLWSKFPQAHFLGPKPHAELARYYAAADVFVFPSLTDTFGLVMLEAMACGTPVAAFRNAAPMTVVQQGLTGFLDDDLARACRDALALDRASIREQVLTKTWDVIAHDLLNAFVPLRGAPAQDR